MQPIDTTQDCAEWYYNEKEVGTAILDFCKKRNIPRSEIFYTTKLHHNVDSEETKKEIQKSLEQCGLDYIDLYLIHGPQGGPAARAACWKAILDVKKEGKIRSAGVSNFGIRHIQELIDAGLEIPAVNQVSGIAHLSLGLCMLYSHTCGSHRLISIHS